MKTAHRLIHDSKAHTEQKGVNGSDKQNTSEQRASLGKLTALAGEMVAAERSRYHQTTSTAREDGLVYTYVKCQEYLYNPTRQTGHLVLAMIFLAVDSPSLRVGLNRRGGDG